MDEKWKYKWVMELSLGMPPGMMFRSVIGYNLESRQGKN